MPLLLLIFVALPLIEIALFITIGGAIGLAASLAIVVGTALFGGWLLRREGTRTLVDVQRAFNDFGDPTVPLAHGALRLVAGVLLILPGFLTDTLGLMLLLPPVRDLLLKLTGRRVVTHVSAGFAVPPGEPAPHRYGRGVVIDGDYVEAPEDEPRHSTTPPSGGRSRPSGWTRG